MSRCRRRQASSANDFVGKISTDCDRFALMGGRMGEVRTLSGAKGTERPVLGAAGWRCSARDRAALRMAEAAALGDDGKGATSATACSAAAAEGS